MKDLQAPALQRRSELHWVPPSESLLKAKDMQTFGSSLANAWTTHASGERPRFIQIQLVTAVEMITLRPCSS